MTEDEMHAEVMAEFAKVHAELDSLLDRTAGLGSGVTERHDAGQDKIMDMLGQILDRLPA